ncbi:hypothetical protein [Ancylomarina sp.]|uniref:hypothetical protein n=1 Tax=Ancylomarina sp. TaxID=1970196 RepID=UPI0035662F66
MRQYKILGLISTIILAANYFIIGPLIPLGFKEYWFDKYLLSHSSFVFPLALIGFYLALFLQVRDIKIPKLINPVAIMLGLAIIKFITDIVQFLGFNYPEIIRSAIVFALMIVFIIWAIMIIKNKDLSLLKIKRFASSMLIGHIIVFLFSFANILFKAWIYNLGQQPFEYINIAYSVYGIGYIFGFLIFISDSKNTSS